MSKPIVAPEVKARPASELWLARGAYHDLRPFYDQHPGGDRVLRDAMGSDVTALVMSHHLTDAPWAALKRYVVPVAGGHAAPAADLDYSFAADGFYMQLRQRVRRFYQEKGIAHPNRAGPYTLLKLVAYMAIFAATWARVCSPSFALTRHTAWVPFLHAFVRLALVGIGHDAIHHNVVPQFPRLQGALFHVFGALTCLYSGRWHYEHVMLHHPHTKTVVDPDEDLPLLRLSKYAKWLPVYRAHVLTQAVLGAGLSYLNTLVELGVFFVERADERARLAKGMSSRTSPPFSLLCALLLHCLPFVFHPAAEAMRISLITCVLTNATILHTFHVSHIVEEAAELPYVPGVDWGAHQCNSTLNFETGGLEGGTLDLQIEHHLFPGLSYEKQQMISPLVKATCAEFGVPYRTHAGVLAAWWAHIKYMLVLADPTTQPKPGEVRTIIGSDDTLTKDELIENAVRNLKAAVPFGKCFFALAAKPAATPAVTPPATPAAKPAAVRKSPKRSPALRRRASSPKAA